MSQETDNRDKSGKLIVDELFPENMITTPGKLHNLLLGNLIQSEQSIIDQISQMFRDGKINNSDIEQLVQRLSVLSFLDDTNRKKKYCDYHSPELISTKIDKIIDDFGRNKSSTDTGKECPIPFEEFCHKIEKGIFGCVFTGHPTFSISEEIFKIQSGLITKRDMLDTECNGGQSKKERLIEDSRRLVELEFRPDKNLSLKFEHTIAIDVLQNAHDALEKIYRITLDVAKRLYPNDWQKLTPKLITLASWLFRDTDGREDVDPIQSFSAILKEKQIQLGRYLHKVNHIQRMWQSSNNASQVNHNNNKQAQLVESELELLKTSLALEITKIENDIAGLENNNEDEINCTENKIWSDLKIGARLLDAHKIIQIINRIVENIDNPTISTELIILKSELANCGMILGLSHFRTNSTKVDNAMRESLRRERGNQNISFGVIEEMLQSHKETISLEAVMPDLLKSNIPDNSPVVINFSAIKKESKSVKKLFMTMAQVLQYCDIKTPIRFLVAEMEKPSTLLSVLYYAKEFGIADKVEICPLFETERGIFTADNIFKELLKNEHFKQYTLSHKKIFIQTGFSDGSRNLGALTMSYYVERLRHKIQNQLSQYFSDDQAIEIVIFDTHGEHPSRGAHPSNFQHRLNHLMPPNSRKSQLQEEQSFQGVEGYTHFGSPALALNTFYQIIKATFSENKKQHNDDPFYNEDNQTFLKEFFQEQILFSQYLMGGDEYLRLINLYGSGLTYPSGSRSVTRANTGSKVHDTHIKNMRRMRAIPNAQRFQQLAIFPPVSGGILRAINSDKTKFYFLAEKSERFREMLKYIKYVMSLTDLDACRKLIGVMKPDSYSLDETIANCSRPEIINFRERLLKLNPTKDLDGLLSQMETDYDEIRRILDPITLSTDTEHECEVLQKTKDNLKLLHSIRVVLMRQIFLISSKIQYFSDQQQTNYDDVMRRIYAMDIEPAIRDLKKIFPKTPNNNPQNNSSKPINYKSDFGYADMHKEIFEPILNLYKLVLRIGTAINFCNGASG